MVDDGSHREPQLGEDEAASSREVIIPKRRRRAEKDDSHAAKPWMLPVWLMIAGTCIAGAGWAISDHLIEGDVQEAAVPLIKAESTPIKVRPQDPGGLRVKDRDKLVLQNIGEEDPEPEIERLLPPPEEPMQKPEPKPVAEAESTAAATIEELNIEPAAAAPEETPLAEKTPPPVRSVDIEEATKEPGTIVETPKDDTEKPAEAVIEEPKAVEPAVAPKPVDKPQQTAAAAPEAVVESSGFYLQLAAARSEEGALGEWAKLVAREKALTAGLEPNVVRADLGDKGIWYRLRTGPFETREAAAEHCDKMKSKNLGCFVVKG